MATFALKLLLAPVFVVGASLCARRWGPRVGGIVGGLPVVAGPILLVFAITHGAKFAGTAAAGILLGLVSLSAFVVVCASLCSWISWRVLLPIGWAAFVAATALMNTVSAGVLAGFVLAGVTFGLLLVVIPSEDAVMAAKPLPRWDLPVRAGCAAAMVVALTGVSSSLGAHLSGLIAAFPVITSVLAAFTHAQSGVSDTRRCCAGWFAGSSPTPHFA